MEIALYLRRYFFIYEKPYDIKEKVIKLASIINKYSGNIKVNIVPFTAIQETILKNVKEEYIITIR